MDFDSLPAEKIVEICEQLDDISLTKFIETSQRHYSICSETLNKRHEERLLNIENDIDEIDQMDIYGGVFYEKMYPKTFIYERSSVIVRNRGKNLFNISQNFWTSVDRFPHVDAILPFATKKITINTQVKVVAKNELRNILNKMCNLGFVKTDQRD